MERYIEVSVQAITADLSTANGDYESIELGKKTPEELIEILSRAKDLQHPDYDSGEDLCPPCIFTEGPPGQLCFMVGDGKITCTEAETDVTPFEAVSLALGDSDIREKAKEGLEQKGIQPALKKDVAPTDQSNTSASTIDTGTSSPQFSLTIWKSKGWRDTALVFFLLGFIFLFLPGWILVFAEGGKEALTGFAISGIGVLVSMIALPIKAGGKTTFTLGFDWKANALFVKRGNKNKIIWEPDANLISGFVLDKMDTQTTPTSMPIGGGDGYAFSGGKERHWGLKTKRTDRQYAMWVEDCFFANKKEAIAIHRAAEQLLNSQK